MAQADQIFAPTTKKSQSVFLLLLLSCAMWRISKNILVSYERFFLFSLRFFVGFLSFEYCLHCFISAWAIITTLTIFLCVIVEILVNIPNQLPIGRFRKNENFNLKCFLQGLFLHILFAYVVFFSSPENLYWLYWVVQFHAMQKSFGEMKTKKKFNMILQLKFIEMSKLTR